MIRSENPQNLASKEWIVTNGLGSYPFPKTTWGNELFRLSNGLVEYWHMINQRV
jgi:hypothetical protein